MNSPKRWDLRLNDADGTLVGLCVQVGDPGGVDSYFGPAQALPFGAGVSPTGGEQ